MYKLLIRFIVCIVCISYASSNLMPSQIALTTLIGLSMSFLIDMLDEKKSLTILILFFIASIKFPILFYAYPLVILSMYKLKPYVLIIPLLCLIKFNLNTNTVLIYSLSALAYMSSCFESKFTSYENTLYLKDDLISLKAKQQKLYELRILDEKNRDIEIAILNERNRISSEIHDSVGHTISGAIIQAEAMRNKDDISFDKQIDALQKNLKSGMADIRTSLHKIHNNSINLKLTIKEILKISPNLDSELKYKIYTELNYEAKYKISSILKEAIANTTRHSDATKIKVSLIELPKHISINISDNGSNEIKEKDFKSGLGILSFREFAENHNGRFTFNFKDGVNLMFLLDKDTLI